MPIPDHEDHRLYAPWRAVVTDNADPRGLHRVRARIPGFIDVDPVSGKQVSTAWATPITSGGGSAQDGGHKVPRVGADVVILFNGGDVDDPIYLSADWGLGSMPDRVNSAGANAHLVHSIQVGSFAVTVDERERNDAAGTGQLVEITDLQSNTGILIDLALHGIDVRADYLLRLRSAGIVQIEGAQVQINGRTVKPGRAEI